MTTELSLAMRIYADATRLVAGLGGARREVKGFTASVKREFDALRGTLSTVEGKLASIGAGVGITQQILASARLDKTLTQIGQTADVDAGQVRGLRGELFQLAAETGQNIEDLRDGFNSLIQSGLNWQQALAVIQATNKATAVTAANSQVLAAGLSVAGENFQFDLAKPGLALELLDKMVVAGRQGNAELENLSSIFSRIGPNSRAAGLGFEQTLAFVEGLSMLERQPERLATLADSTLRLFTNLNYMREAQNATGVRFFDANQQRRNPLDVLKDLREQYRGLQTDAQRARFIGRAFGNADIDTQRGLRSLLGGDLLERIGGFADQISSAGGTLERDLGKAIDNSVDQVGRLKAVLRTAADEFAQHFNAGLSGGIKKLLDTKDRGGFGLSGGELLGGAAVAAAGLFAAGRYGGPLLKKIAGSIGGTAAGVAEGKALEAAAGVTPVFVVNMPSGGVGGAIADTVAAAAAAGSAAKLIRGARAGALALSTVPIGVIPSMGAGALATAAGGVSLAALGGYGFGTALNKLLIEGTGFSDALGGAIAKAMSPFSSEAREALSTRRRERELEARERPVLALRSAMNPEVTPLDVEKALAAALGPVALDARMRDREDGSKVPFEGRLRIEIDADGRANVRELRTDNPGFALDVHSGLSLVTG